MSYTTRSRYFTEAAKTTDQQNIKGQKKKKSKDFMVLSVSCVPGHLCPKLLSEQYDPLLLDSTSRRISSPSHLLSRMNILKILQYRFHNHTLSKRLKQISFHIISLLEDRDDSKITHQHLTTQPFISSPSLHWHSPLSFSSVSLLPLPHHQSCYHRHSHSSPSSPAF